MTVRDPFCEHCGIVLSLHPWPDDQDPGCEVAESRAWLLSDFAFLGRLS